MSTVHRDAERQDRLHRVHQGRARRAARAVHHELVGEEPRPLTPERRAEILRANEALAGEALRTLGVAARWLPDDAGSPSADGGVDARVEQDLVFAGLIGMIDPPRAEARDAVARARALASARCMITGDHPRTAAVIARELGIADDGRVVTGAELEQMTRRGTRARRRARCRSMPASIPSTSCAS